MQDASGSDGAGPDHLLATITGSVPYLKFMGIRVDRRGHELTAIMDFRQGLIGNPFLPALHGGVTAAFLEVAALVELAWHVNLRTKETALDVPDLRIPKTISISVDYLRPGLPKEAFARAEVTRSGRRFASVHVEGWQDTRSRAFAQATGHFQLPPANE